MLTVADVLAMEELRLALVAGSAGLDRAVQSAHVSELADPTGWLRGGELLMTTGMRLHRTQAAARAYFEAVRAAGVAGVALGLGADLTYRSAPNALVRAANECGLPLIEVPEATPFIAITKAVFGRLAEQQYAEVLRASVVQRDLTAAALRPDGTAALAAVFARSTGNWVVVTDTAGSPITAHPPEAAHHLGRLAPELDRLRSRGVHASASLSTEQEHIGVQALGADRLLGFLVYGGPGQAHAYERMVTSAAVSLLSIVAERQRAGLDVHRRQQSRVLRKLLAAPTSEAHAAALLSELGIGEGLVRVAVARPRDTAVHHVLADQVSDALAKTIPDAVVFAEDGSAIVLIPDANPDAIPGAISGANPDAESRPSQSDADPARTALITATRGAFLGIGARTSPGNAARSLQQARLALRTGQRRGQRVSDATTLGIASLLLGFGDVGALRAYADGVLSALDTADHGGDLTRSVRAFLDANGAWEVAAAHMGVHRHTMRHRVERAERVMGRRLDDARERVELWLAFEARDLAGPPISTP
jgi:purine catabolism regulator